MSLFDPGPGIAPPEPLSADRRRTLRRSLQLAAGVHPTTRLPLRQPVGEHTCGDCGHHLVHTRWPRHFHKCDAVILTFGPGSDVRIGWPACTKWQPEVAS